jgi:glycosyltransferase involved in cell wall biosynthesis
MRPISNPSIKTAANFLPLQHSPAQQQTRFGKTVWLTNASFPIAASDKGVNNPGLMNGIVENLIHVGETPSLIAPVYAKQLDSVKQFPKSVVTVPLLGENIAVDVYTEPKLLHGKIVNLYHLHHPTFTNNLMYNEREATNPKTGRFTEVDPYWGLQPQLKKLLLFNKASNLVLQSHLDAAHQPVLMPQEWTSTLGASEFKLNNKHVPLMYIQHNGPVYHQFEYHQTGADKVHYQQLLKNAGVPVKPLTQAISPRQLRLEGHMRDSHQCVSIPAVIHHLPDALLSNPENIQFILRQYLNRHGKRFIRAVNHLKQLLASNKVFTLHHRALDYRNPDQTHLLTAPYKTFKDLGINTPLTQLSTNQMAAFKAHNRKALLQQLQVTGVEHPMVMSFVSRLTYLKNPVTSLLVAQQLLDKHPNLVFVLAGPDQINLPGFTNLMNKLKQHPRFRYMGNLAEKQIAEVNAGSDISLNPSYIEAFGLTTIEALQMGSILVTMPAGGNKKVLVDGQALTPAPVWNFIPSVNTVDSTIADNLDRFQHQFLTEGRTNGLYQRYLTEATEAMSQLLSNCSFNPSVKHQMQLNGLQQVITQHNLPTIAQMYKVALHSLRQHFYPGDEQKPAT